MVFHMDGSPDEPNDELPSNSAAVLRDAVEADEDEDLKDGEGKNEHP